MSNKGNVFVEGLAMRPNGKTVTDLAIAIFGEEMRAVVVNATNEIGNCFTTIETTPTLVARSCTLFFVGLNSFLNGRSVPYGVAYLLEPIGSNACATTLTQQRRGCLLSAQKRAHINFIEASIC